MPNIRMEPTRAGCLPRAAHSEALAPSPTADSGEQTRVNEFERHVRANVIQGLRDTGTAPSVSQIGEALGADAASVSAALHALADEHRLVLVPGTERVMMAHPFSGVASDFVVTIGEGSWFANCVWDGLSILGLLGDGTLETHSPATGEIIRLSVIDGAVEGDAVVHFLVAGRHFWDDIVFT